MKSLRNLLVSAMSNCMPLFRILHSLNKFVIFMKHCPCNFAASKNDNCDASDQITEKEIKHYHNIKKKKDNEKD